jgi:hypothetical protein
MSATSVMAKVETSTLNRRPPEGLPPQNVRNILYVILVDTLADDSVAAGEYLYSFQAFARPTLPQVVQATATPLPYPIH